MPLDGPFVSTLLKKTSISVFLLVLIYALVRSLQRSAVPAIIRLFVRSFVFKATTKTKKKVLVFVDFSSLAIALLRIEMI